MLQIGRAPIPLQGDPEVIFPLLILKQMLIIQIFNSKLNLLKGLAMSSKTVVAIASQCSVDIA